MVRFTAVRREHFRRGCSLVLLLANYVTKVTWPQFPPLQSKENRTCLQRHYGDRINGKVLRNKHKMQKGDETVIFCCHHKAPTCVDESRQPPATGEEQTMQLQPCSSQVPLQFLLPTLLHCLLTLQQPYSLSVLRGAGMSEDPT